MSRYSEIRIRAPVHGDDCDLPDEDACCECLLRKYATPIPIAAGAATIAAIMHATAHIADSLPLT